MEVATNIATPNIPAATPAVEDIKPPVVTDVDTKPVEDVKPPEPPKDFAEEFARLKQYEKQLRRQQREAEEKVKSYEEKYRGYEDFEDKNPLKALAAKGWGPEKILEFMAEGEVPEIKESADPVVRKLQQELKELKDQRLAEEKRAQDLEKQKEIDDGVNHISSLMQAAGEEFEMVRHFKLERAVYDMAAKEYEETQDVPDIKEVARRVEKQYRAEIERLFETGYMKRLAETKIPKPVAPIEPTAASTTQKTPIAPTISQQTTASTKPGQKYSSEEEALKESARKLQAMWDRQKS